ncbi:hypothetical protein BDV93DRAFT_520814 [Ceratobasidium sp. AG-I]|nr:hypothetical protein BDV93DRAFT_520814 [Ceratobasidium sp. AG-I]
MATSLLDPAAQHAADLVQARGLGTPDRNALLAGVLALRGSKSGLFSKDSKAKERDLRVFLFDCAIVLLTPNDKDKDGLQTWSLFCDPIPIELITLRAPRPALSASSSPLHTPTARRRSWFLDRLPDIAPGPARAKTPPPLASPRAVAASPSPPPSSAIRIPPSTPTKNADDFSLVLSSLGRRDPNKTWPVTLQAADAGEQRAWVQSVMTRQEDVRARGRDGSGRGWKLVPVPLGAATGGGAGGIGKVTCYVDYDVGYAKARLWGTPDGLYEHIWSAPNQSQGIRKILDLQGVTHVLVMDFDERLMIVLVAEQTAYLAPFPGPTSMLELSRLKRIGTNITHIAAGVLVIQPPPPAGSAPPSAFVDPGEEKQERRKSATLTKPPPRAAVISGASSSKSDVPSGIRVKDKDRESVRTVDIPTVRLVTPAGAASNAAVSATASDVPTPAAAPTTANPAPSATVRSVTAPSTTRASSLAPPSKTKEKEKKARRLSDIAIFSLWKRKPEKDKAGKDKTKAGKDKALSMPPTPTPATSRFSTATVDSRHKLDSKSKPPFTSATIGAKAGRGNGNSALPVDKPKAATLPPSLMRIPSLEFDRDEKLNASDGDSAQPTAGATAKATESPTDTNLTDVDETGALVNQAATARPSVQSQTMPSRSSTGGGLARGLTMSRKRTNESNRPEKSKEAGPPPKIQIALDFPSIAWPSVLENSQGDKDQFIGSDFLADVQRDLGDLVAGGLGMSLSEEKAGMVLGENGNGATIGRSRSPVPEAITEEPESVEKEKGKENTNGNGNGHAEQVQKLTETRPSAPEAPPIPAQPQVVPPTPVEPQVQMLSHPQAPAPSRSAQPQHVRYLVLSKSTTLSTSVKLYTVGGLKIEDEGDIGGGRLSLFKECYVPSQTFSIHFLKSRICFGGSDGFEIMDPSTGKLEPFLDPVEVSDAEGPLGFLITHPRRPKVCAVFRVDQKFLCCYDEFAFFLDKFGKRAREDWLVKWLGTPTHFSVQYPYLFAFDPEFTEIRHCSTGELLQIIPQPNMTRVSAGEFIAPAQKQEGVPLRRVDGEVLLESDGSLYALRPMQQQ